MSFSNVEDDLLMEQQKVLIPSAHFDFVRKNRHPKIINKNEIFNVIEMFSKYQEILVPPISPMDSFLYHPYFQIAACIGDFFWWVKSRCVQSEFSKSKILKNFKNFDMFLPLRI